MNAKRLIATLLLALPMLGNAQELKDFEGEFISESLTNQNPERKKFDTGMLYNGRVVTHILAKGDNVDSYDTRLKMHTMFLVDTNRYILWSEELKKGVEIPITTYVAGQKALLAAAAKLAPVEQNWNVESLGKEDINGITCEHLKKTLTMTANQVSSTSIQEEWISDVYRNPMKKFLESIGTSKQSDGFALKLKFDTHIKSSSAFVKSRYSYNHTVVKEIMPRAVADNEFDIPSDCKIQVFDDFLKFNKAFMALGRANAKLLMKQGKHPTQMEDNVIYETDDRWDD